MINIVIHRKKLPDYHLILSILIGLFILSGSFYSKAFANPLQTIDFALSLQKVENTSKPNQYLQLILPVPKGRMLINSELTLITKQKAVPAKFFVQTVWPEEIAEHIRLLSIQIPSIYGMSENFTLTWQAVDAQNKNTIIQTPIFAQLMPTTFVSPNKSWLLSSLLLHPANAVVETADWYIKPQAKFAAYVSNTELLRSKKYPPEQSSQWLYDRPQALYQLFAMSGDKQWLAHANRLSEFYIDHIGENGFFTLRKGNDIKYLMPRGVLYRYLLTADPRAKNTLSALFEASLPWDPTYDIGRGFWTERNQAAALNVAITYWELTNSKKAQQRINDIIDATVDMTFKPANGWQLVGCPQHSFKSHEGWGDKSPACSPWMMALLGDALWRYYRLTEDKRVGKIPIAKYLVSLNNPKQEEPNQWTDPQHACDIAGLLGKSVYIKEQNKQDSFMGKTLFSAFAKQCYGMYQGIKKEKGKAKPYWTLKPPRRFGWMYSSTSDLPWLVEEYIPELLLGY